MGIPADSQPTSLSGAVATRHCDPRERLTRELTAGRVKDLLEAWKAEPWHPWLDWLRAWHRDYPAVLEATLRRPDLMGSLAFDEWRRAMRWAILLRGIHGELDAAGVCSALRLSTLRHQLASDLRHLSDSLDDAQLVRGHALLVDYDSWNSQSLQERLWLAVLLQRVGAGALTDDELALLQGMDEDGVRSLGRHGLTGAMAHLGYTVSVMGAAFWGAPTAGLLSAIGNGDQQALDWLLGQLSSVAPAEWWVSIRMAILHEVLLGKLNDDLAESVIRDVPLPVAHAVILATAQGVRGFESARWHCLTMGRRLAPLPERAGLCDSAEALSQLIDLEGLSPLSLLPCLTGEQRTWALALGAV